MSRGPKLAGYIALAYTLVIVYASLQPFAGWRMPPDEVLRFLTAPWPRYITATDIALNVVAYLPLGAMLYFALRPPLAPAAAFVIATLVAAVLSLLLESVQMFLPARIASNVDLLSNSAGAVLGALGAIHRPDQPDVARHDARQIGQCHHGHRGPVVQRGQDPIGHEATAR